MVAPSSRGRLRVGRSGSWSVSSCGEVAGSTLILVEDSAMCWTQSVQTNLGCCAVALLSVLNTGDASALSKSLQCQQQQTAQWQSDGESHQSENPISHGCNHRGQSIPGIVTDTVDPCPVKVPKKFSGILDFISKMRPNASKDFGLPLML